MFRYLILPLLLLLPALRLPAQQLLGLAGSNRAGSQAVILNPSAIADSRHGFHLNLFTGHASFSNTYFHYEGPRIRPRSLLAGESEDIFDRAYIRERLDGNAKMAFSGLDMRLPSFMLKLSPRHSIAITSRFRTAVQASNVSEDLARVIGFGTANASIQDIPFRDQEGYFNMNVFSETGLTYARVLLSQEKRFLKGGITLKKLGGLYTAHLMVPEMDYQVLQDVHGDSFVRVQQGSASLGFSRSEFELEEEEVLDALTWKNIPGSGWGIDLGFTYEHRPRYADYQFTINEKERTDHGQNKYKYRIGAALLDLGGISYNDPRQVRSYKFSRQNLDLNDDTFEDLDMENLEEALELQPSERQSSIRSGLPATLHLNFDYRISRVLFLNTALLHNLRGKESIAMRQNSLLAIAPRIETKALELAVPLSLINNYRDLALGAMLRFGPLLLGSNNLSALLREGKTTGADFYLGLGFGFGTGGQKKRVEKRERKRAEKAAEVSETESKNN